MKENQDRPVPVTAVSSAPVTVTIESQADPELQADLIVRVVPQATHTFFAGAFKNHIAPRVISMLEGTRERMLVDAVNNRTRERNYYQLYSRLLENEISEEEFDNEIDENPDDYVISTDKVPSEIEFHEAIALSDHIKGIETTGDIESLFSLNGEVFNEYCKRLLNGSL